MARLSGYLAGQLANPSYSGMLGQNIQGGMQGIADSFGAKRERQAQDSMITMLTNFDPNDPKVIDSVMAVGRQTGQDPKSVLALVQNAQAQAREKAQETRAVAGEGRAVRGDAIREIQLKMAQEDQARQAESMQMAREDQKIQMANHAMTVSNFKWNQSLQQKAVQQSNAVNAVMKIYDTDPAKAEEAVQNVPGEFQTEVLSAIQGRKKHDSDMATYREEAQLRDGLSPDTLKAIASEGKAGELIVKAYEGTKGEGKSAAAAQALSAYNKIVENKGYVLSGGRGEEDKPDQPSEWEATSAENTIRELEGSGIWNLAEGGVEVPSELMGKKDGDKIKPGLLAIEAAKAKKNDDTFQITPDWIKAQVMEYKSQTEKAPERTESEVIAAYKQANPGLSDADARAEAKKAGYIK